jgi:ADP-ribose pyrophosphatase
MESRVSPRLLDSRTMYKGRIFDAIVERIQMPDRERPFEAEVVRHARSVGIAAMPGGDSLILVRQYRHAVNAWFWELPAGSVDEGEDAETAARRECQEELGLVAGSVERLGELVPLPGYCTEEMTLFRITGLREPRAGDPDAHQDEDEDLESRVFTLADVRRMIRSGEVRDMKTAAVLMLLEG